MSTTGVKAPKRAGIPHTKPEKVPTPPLQRTHSWRYRFNVQKMRWEMRPSRIGMVRYDIRDLGWQIESKYLTRFGKLTRAARA